MDKTAQKRSLLNKLHEMANVPARSAENFFKPELKRIMNTLTDADDVIRSTLAGERVGKASPQDPVSAKDLLKEAKSFINRREYMSAVADLGRFHKKMQDVSNVLDGLKLNVDSLHHQFLFNKLPGKHRQQLEDLSQRFASERLPYFTKEAGIMDFFHNIGTRRGRALAAWEKRYPKVVAKLREGAQAQLESAYDLLNTSLSLLKTMATHRAARNIDAYLEAGRELSAAFRKYDSGKNGFRSFYNDTIKPYMDAQRKMEEEQTSASPTAVENMITEQAKKNLQQADVFGNPPATPVAAPEAGSQFGHVSIPAPIVPTTNLPSPPDVPQDVNIPTPSPTVPSLPPLPTPQKFRSDEVAEELFGGPRPKKSSYEAFVDSLQVFADEDPSLLASHIAKYAKSIQAEQPEIAVKLFRIAKSLRG